MSIAAHYPFPEYRKYAKEALQKADAAFESGKRFVLIDAPPGAGKSPLAVAFARHFKTPIVTPTKILQNQYADTPEFTTEYVIFGKSNYKCGLEEFNHLTVDQAICCSNAATLEYANKTDWYSDIKKDKQPAQKLKSRCTQAGICEYYKLIGNIPIKPSPVLNLDLFFHLKKNPLTPNEGVEMGTDIVIDEAHHILSKAKSIFGYSLNEANLVKLLGKEAKRKGSEAPSEWMGRLLLLSHSLLQEESDLKSAPALSIFYRNLKFICQFNIDDKNKFFVEDKQDQVEIKPVDFRYLKNIIFHPFKRVLLLSATFPKNFCQMFGIKPSEVEIITIPSTFPKKNRPFYFIKDLPALNYKSNLTATHETIVALKKVLASHKSEKGIIHCSNYSFFRQLQKIFKGDKRFLWVEQGHDKTKYLTKHAESKLPTVLVSPSMIEGVDLKDDLARFQVILKIPYPTLDEYTRRMMDIYSDYYENQVATAITQSYGRAVRTPEDTAKLYCLDGAFSRLLSKQDLFSNYVLEAVSQITTKNL